MSRKSEKESVEPLLASNLESMEKTLSKILIQGDSPIVVALIGGWGEGKTYFWRKTFSPMYSSYQPGISYLSVFGSSSLEAIRNQVAVSVAATRLKYHDSRLARFKRRIFGKIRFGGAVKNALSYFGVQSPPSGFLADVVEQYIYPPGWILCIDDVERISNRIDFDAFLGYVNSLRDDHGVKVVMIYNDEKVTGDESKRQPYEKYADKVVDREVYFTPDITSILQHVFAPDIAVDSEVFGELIRRCGVLDLKNVRILRRVLRYHSELKGALTQVDPRVVDAGLYSILLFCWIRFANEDADKYGLSFEYLQKYTYFSESMLIFLDNDNGPDKLEKSPTAAKLLEDFSYSHTDELDQLLMNFVISGTFDIDAIIVEANRLSENYVIDSLSNKFHDVWKKTYHSTLRDTSNEFCTELIAATESYIQYISPNQLDQVLVKLRKLERLDESDRLFRLFLEVRGNSLRDTIDRSIMEPIEFEELQLVIDDALKKSTIDKRELNEVVDSVVAEDFLSDVDGRRFSEFTPEDIVNYFMSVDREHLTSTIRHISKLSRNASNEAGRKVRKNIDEAVRAISSQSQINKMRMESMGLLESED